MKLKYADLALLFCCASAPLFAEGSCGELVFSDEFSEDGAPNPEKWDYEHGFVRNMELQWYRPENAHCRNGLLVIEARREKVKNPNFGREPKTHWGNAREFAEYASACVISRGSFDFRRGRLEVRARIPFGKGAWPAIWLLGESIRGKSDRLPWPACGEIDVMEFYRIGGVPNILANFAWEGAKPGSSVWNGKKIPLSHFLAKDPDWLANFHVWRMDWDEKSYRIFLDGELLNEMPLEKSVNAGKYKGINPFLKPQYLLLNLAVGNPQKGKGPVDDDAMPMRYEIDYVRVYKFPESGENK